MENSINQNTNRFGDMPTNPLTQPITPPNNVEAMRAGLMRERYAPMQMPPPPMFYNQTLAPADNFIIQNPSLSDVPVLISSIASLIAKIKSNYDPANDNLFAKNILLHEIAITDRLAQTPVVVQVSKQLSIIIHKELVTLPSLLSAYHDAVAERVETFHIFNIIKYFNQGKMYAFLTSNNNESSNPTPVEKENQEQTVFSNEKLTELVFEMATALDGLRAEVRNLAAKTMPMGGRY